MNRYLSMKPIGVILLFLFFLLLHFTANKDHESWEANHSQKKVPSLYKEVSEE